jgi:hypothetical protein
MSDNSSRVPDLQRMRISAETQPTPEWHGDLDDDCTALWAGFVLRAESMDEDYWWWAVYLEAQRRPIASSNDSDAQPTSGEEARALALRAAKAYLSNPPLRY